jgi:hypothetical protein
MEKQMNYYDAHTHFATHEDMRGLNNDWPACDNLKERANIESEEVVGEREQQQRVRQGTPFTSLRRLPAMAPAQDPALPRVKRTSPINRTCNFWRTNETFSKILDKIRPS